VEAVRMENLVAPAQFENTNAFVEDGLKQQLLMSTV
jgi:hypothetical protein